MTATVQAHSDRRFAINANRAVYWFSKHWFFTFNVALLVYAGLPWLAPVFMYLGWETLGRTVYALYSTQCHQLPQRSYFLFGPQASYSLAEVQALWQNTNNPLILREYIGSAATGWKVAWSDRMVWMYTMLIPAGLVFTLFRRWLRPLPWWGLALFLLPMALDGGTHLISDFAGIGDGFRDSNVWLAVLTNNAFPATFYAGDAIGSFNAWMRLFSGVAFAVGLVWFAYPHLEVAFADMRREIESKFSNAGLRL